MLPYDKCGEVEPKKAEEPKPIPMSQYEAEIEAIEHYLGATLSDIDISFTLQELNGIVPRKRVRSDAYKGLIDYVRLNRNTNITIRTRKTK